MPDEAVGHLHRAGQLARRSLTEARRSVHALRPEALQRYNFWDALKDIVKNTTAGTALRTSFGVRGGAPDFPPSWQENLMHIGQEALTNTLKYAHARNFETHLVRNAKEVRLEFSDDGDGFKLRDRHDGMGLTGMRERAEQMGGKLIIASSRKNGSHGSASPKRRMRIYVVSFYLLLFGLWQMVISLHWAPDYLFPSPFQVFKRLYELITEGYILPSLEATLYRMGIGFSIALALGLTIGLLMGTSTIAHACLNSLFLGLQTLPTAAWAPLSLLIFGLKDQGIYFVIVMSAAPAVACPASSAL